MTNPVTAANTAQPTLPTLPEEVRLAIAEHCDLDSLLALYRTNRTFNTLCQPVVNSHRTERVAFLFTAQGWTIEGGHRLACFTCLKLLPWEDFSHKQTKGRRNIDGDECYLRFCAECGVRTGLHKPRTVVAHGYAMKVVCGMCKKSKGGRYCTKCLLCEDCDRKWRRPDVGEMRCHGTPGHCIMGARRSGGEGEPDGPVTGSKSANCSAQVDIDHTLDWANTTRDEIESQVAMLDLPLRASLVARLARVEIDTGDLLAQSRSWLDEIGM